MIKMSFPIDAAAGAMALPVDYRTLVAGIVGRQSTSRTATLAARLVLAAPAVRTVEALAATLLAAPDRAGGAILRGSFHPAAAALFRGKTGSTNVKPPFTFAFQRSFNADELMADPAGGPKLGETACLRCQ